MKRIAFSVFGSAFALGALVFGGALFSGAGVAEAAFPGADGLTAISQSCMADGTTQTAFGWTSYNQGSQWLDVSTDPGFGPGSFTSSGPIASGQNSFVMSSLPSGVT